MKIFELIKEASQPEMTQESIQKIIKSRHIPMEEKRELAELTFNSVTQVHEGGCRVDTFYKDFMIKMLI